MVMTNHRIYAMRDKYGLRPLSIGRIGDGYVLSSETCAFSVVGAEFVRDVEPGEVVTIDHHGIRSQKYSDYQRHAMCAMEYIYFSRPDSDIEGRNVHSFRKESGKILYRKSHVDADIVVGVPDSSLSAASGYAEASGLPNEMGLIKNRYIGRTFIQPSQEMRDKGVKMKLSPVRSIVKDKRIILVDDSIVRGTTSLKNREDAARGRSERGSHEDRQADDQESVLLWCGYVHPQGAALLFQKPGAGPSGHRGRLVGVPF